MYNNKSVSERYPYGKIVNYKTGKVIRAATQSELKESKTSAMFDNGRGVICIEGVPCYVEE